MQNPKCDEPAPPVLPLPDGSGAPVLLELDHLLVIDKPPGWRGAPSDPESSARNLQKTLETAVENRADWVASLRLRFLRVVHSPDACASGLALLATDLDTARNMSRLLDRAGTRPDEQYLAVVGGKPNHRRWTCRLKLRPDPEQAGRFLTDTRQGFHAVTEFEVLSHGDGMALLMATPATRHPHQIRAHLGAMGLPVVGDVLYGFGRDLASPEQRARRGPRPPGAGSGEAVLPAAPRSAPRLPAQVALRSVRFAFPGFPGFAPFEVTAPVDAFLAHYGFSSDIPALAADDPPPEGASGPSSS